MRSGKIRPSTESWAVVVGAVNSVIDFECSDQPPRFFQPIASSAVTIPSLKQAAADRPDNFSSLVFYSLR